MSTVNIVIGVVFLVCVLAGMWQGMFRVLISVAGLIASMVVAVYIAPHVSGYIEQNMQVDEKLAQYITDKLQFSESGEETSRGIQVALIEELPLPETMKQNILDNNNSEMYGVLNAVGVYDYIARSIAMVVLNASIFLVLVLICRIFFFFLGRTAKGLSKLPILSSIDKVGGGMLGAIKGLILIWIFFLVLSVTSAMDWSQTLIGQINQSAILKMLYDNNVLVGIVGDLTKLLFL